MKHQINKTADGKSINEGRYKQRGKSQHGCIKKDPIIESN